MKEYAHKVEGSSNVAGVGWNGGELKLTFHNVTSYKYSGVPEGHYHMMIAAKSVGTYFDKYVKGKYPHKKLG